MWAEVESPQRQLLEAVCQPPCSREVLWKEVWVAYFHGYHKYVNHSLNMTFLDHYVNSVTKELFNLIFYSAVQLGPEFPETILEHLCKVWGQIIEINLVFRVCYLCLYSVRAKSTTLNQKEVGNGKYLFWDFTALLVNYLCTISRLTGKAGP